MFGYPCAVVGGNMFMSLHGANLVLRLPESRIEELLRREGCTPFEPMPGRAMRGYVSVAPDLLHDRELVNTWVQAAFEHGAGLPAKVRAARKPRRGT